MSPSEIQRLLDLESRVRKSSELLDRLRTGALAAFTGGTVAIGLLGGSFFWIPAAMGASLLAYRALLFWAGHDERRQRRQLEKWDEVIRRMEKLEKAKLSPQGRLLLASSLESELDGERPTGRE